MVKNKERLGFVRKCLIHFDALGADRKGLQFQNGLYYSDESNHGISIKSPVGRLQTRRRKKTVTKKKDILITAISIKLIKYRITAQF